MPATKLSINLFWLDSLVEKKWYQMGKQSWKIATAVRREPSGDTLKFGEPDKVFEVAGQTHLPLDWNQELEIRPDDRELVITVRVTGEGEDQGEIKATLNVPVYSDYELDLTSSKNRFSANVRVRITERTEPAPAVATSVIQHLDSPNYNTLHEQMLKRLVHIHPVIPVPWSDLPPTPRPLESLIASPQPDYSIKPDATAPNALVNPAVIPVLDRSTMPIADFDQKCARIRLTRWIPNDVDLGRLIWKATPNIQFLQGAGGTNEIRGHDGREVKAYGVLVGADDEEGRIEVRWDSPGTPLLTAFRAWVGKPKYLWVRANIIKCSHSTWGGLEVKNPEATPAQIIQHIRYNNILLWQMGIQLVMDPEPKSFGGQTWKVETTTEPGIYTVESDDNFTCNVVDDENAMAAVLNSRGKVLNLAFIHSIAAEGVCGSTVYRGLSVPAYDKTKKEAPDGSESLDGTPSTSWVRPSGVFPDDDAGKVSMKTLGASAPVPDSLAIFCGEGVSGKLCAILLTDLATNNPQGANTLAHEVGHVLGLHHRGYVTDVKGSKANSRDGVVHQAGKNKGRGYPWKKNVMSYAGVEEAQDFDLIQAKAARKHQLLRDSPTL